MRKPGAGLSAFAAVAMLAACEANPPEAAFEFGGGIDGGRLDPVRLPDTGSAPGDPLSRGDSQGEPDGADADVSKVDEADAAPADGSDLEDLGSPESGGGDDDEDGGDTAPETHDGRATAVGPDGGEIGDETDGGSSLPDAGGTGDDADVDGEGPEDGDGPEPPSGCETASDCEDAGPPAPECSAWECLAGECVVLPSPGGLPCQVLPDGVSADCVESLCDGGGACVAVPNPGADCEDGNPCTTGETCATNGACKGGVPVVCTAPSACQIAVCDSQMGGCVGFPASNGLPCADANPCTTGTTCQAGLCQGGTNPCKCVVDADCADDGDLCNGVPTCEPQLDGSLACEVLPPSTVTCPKPEDACLKSVCVPETGLCETAILPGSKCSDGDKCTGPDLCDDAGTCAGKPKGCDDGDPCTKDACDGKSGFCSHVALNGGPCSDGDACTTGDACKNGVCAGTPKNCFDGKPCTSDACDPEKGKCTFPPLDGAECSDGNACTAGDLCAGDLCAPGAYACTDGDPCTEDLCDPDVGCSHLPAEGPCDDGDACTAGDVCADGGCSGAPVDCSDGVPCTVDDCDPGAAGASGCVHQPDDGACDDGKPCTADLCSANGCQHALAAAPCDDGDACTEDDVCQAGLCAGVPADCNDGLACTFDSCAPATGCAHKTDQASCDDGNACTDDVCDKVFGCLHANPSGLPCSDGLACTVGDKCKAGQCKPGPNLCACSTDADCDDADLCNGVFECQPAAGGGTSCVEIAEPVACGGDPGGPCLANACAPESGQCGVVPLPGGTPCPDNDACTTGEICGGGLCQKSPASCGDGIDCTTESCDPETGCHQLADDGACDDGIACTIDACLPAAGCQHVADAASCDDGVGCTVDACDPTAGCANVPDAGSCPPGNACLVAVCDVEAGCGIEVVAGGCDDGNACTSDACDPETGCKHGHAQGPCHDGNPCTEGDVCAAGDCKPGAPKPCDDGNPCTLDGCSGSTGSCTAAPLANGVSCEDGDPCTEPDLCQAGACAPGPDVTCDDGVPCTADACEPDGGCSNAPEDAACDDLNACTIDTCVPGQGCAHAPLDDFTPCNDGTAGTTPDVCIDGSCLGFQSAEVKVSPPFLCEMVDAAATKVADLDGVFFAVVRYTVGGFLCGSNRSQVLHLNGASAATTVNGSVTTAGLTGLSHDAVAGDDGKVGRLVFSGGWLDGFANDLQAELYVSVGLGPWADVWAERLLDGSGATYEERYYLAGRTANGVLGRVVRCIREHLGGGATDVTCATLGSGIAEWEWKDMDPVAIGGRVVTSLCDDCPETMDGTAVVTKDASGGASLLVAGANDAYVRIEVPGDPVVRDVARFGPNDVWVTGANGYLARWNGASWDVFSGPAIAASLDLRAVLRTRGNVVVTGFGGGSGGTNATAWLLALGDGKNPASGAAWKSVSLGSPRESYDLHATDGALHVVGRQPKNAPNKRTFVWFLDY